MITIGELYDVCDENRDLEIVAVLNGKEINLSGSFYVESEITYYYNDESDTCTCNQIIHGIECEAEDDCWM